jgi:MSHA pilin protein MshA
MFHGRWLAAGSPATGTYDGVTVGTGGWLTGDAAGFTLAAGGLNDYNVSYAGSVVTVATDTGHANCKITYDGATGVVSVAPALSACE